MISALNSYVTTTASFLDVFVWTLYMLKLVKAAHSHRSLTV
jgi:hypothetical protein